MKPTIITEGTTLDEFLIGIKKVNEQLLEQKANTRDILAKWIPELTREQAAYILQGSTNHVNSLVSQGHLQEILHGKGKRRFSTKQVWQCREAGFLGRKRIG